MKKPSGRDATRCIWNCDCLWQSASGAQSGASPSGTEGYREFEADLSALFWQDTAGCASVRRYYKNISGAEGDGSHRFISYQVWRCTTISNLMINEQIRDKEVRLIGPDGAQLGIVSAKEAMMKAQEAGLDLVKIAPQAKPPVCKIIDYGKYRYELARKEKEAKKKQKTIDIKEVRLSPNIDTNDLNTKVNAARKFLSKGDRVKVTLRFRGREMAHMASSKHVLDDFADLLKDVATVEKAPKVEGRSMTMFLTEKR